MYISNTLASTTSHVGGEAAEPNETVGDVEDDYYTRMDGNSAHQHTDANISFGRNGTNITTASEIVTEQNAAYTHCDMAALWLYLLQAYIYEVLMKN